MKRVARPAPIGNPAGVPEDLDTRVRAAAFAYLDDWSTGPADS